MFTTYIHTLEVLAMHPEGTTVNKIVSMGSEWSPQHISATLKWLEKEGYVKRWKAGRGYVWQVTEKAIEYCETIVRKYNASHVMDEIAEYVASVPENAIAPTQETITEVSTNPAPLNVESTKISFPLMGLMTIAEMVTAIENTSAVTVTRATCEDGMVTLTVEPIPQNDDKDFLPDTEFDLDYCSGCNCPNHSCACLPF